MPDEKEISWDILTHVHRERSVDWYWALGIIAVVAAAVSAWFGNSLFAIIIILAAGSIGTLMARGPREHSVTIMNKGVSIDGTLFPYRSIHSFWVELPPQEMPELSPRLYLSTSGVLAPRMRLPLESIEQAREVRSYLKRFAKEEEQEPHLGAHLAEIFGL